MATDNVLVMKIQIKSKEIKILPINSIVESPDNPNRHDTHQIERLAKLIKHNGFRDPLIVSKLSGYLVAGHCRLLAAKLIGMQEIPVVFQDFLSPSEEFQFKTAHNEIARWAELDKQMVYDKIKELEIPDLELMGIDDLKMPELDIIDDGVGNEKGDKTKSCPHCGELI